MKGQDHQAILQRDVIELPASTVRAVQTAGLGLGVVGLGAAAFLGFQQGDHYTRFSFAYLIAWAFFLAISLGALFFVTLQHLTRAGWSVVVRRIAEGMSSTVALMAILSLPIIVPALLGNHSLFPWADAAHVAEDHVLHHKAPYLNTTFFLIRCAIYFGAWILMSRYFAKNSLKQDESGDPALSQRAERGSAPMMFVFALTVTFAAFDFLMSLEPHWFSTIFGVYYFAGCLVSFFATIILVSLWLQSRGLLKNSISVEHYHDLGKLLFAFNFFWGYIAFSQFMLIWYANLPEETFWYLARQKGGWLYVSLALLFVHLLIPFVGLVSRHAKRNLKILAFWSVWLLVAHWIDMFYLAAPAMNTHGHIPEGVVPFGILDVACFVGIGGFFIAFLMRALKGKSLVPLKDPRLAESLSFENV